jgi:hypothetical protein
MLNGSNPANKANENGREWQSVTEEIEIVATKPILNVEKAHPKLFKNIGGA